jgi:hypothetical protein
MPTRPSSMSCGVRTVTASSTGSSGMPTTCSLAVRGLAALQTPQQVAQDRGRLGRALGATSWVILGEVWVVAATGPQSADSFLGGARLAAARLAAR